jgi:cell fate (sporulation/competence/biofilm development) regulator YmcA (YheA/YmcA/DUF963 family)
MKVMQMVIKANELVNKIKQTELENFKKAEKKIDEIIRKDFDGEKVQVWESELFDINNIHRNKLFSKYESAGWNIAEESVSPPLEGTQAYYWFTPKNKINYER